MERWVTEWGRWVNSSGEQLKIVTCVRVRGKSPALILNATPVVKWVRFGGKFKIGMLKNSPKVRWVMEGGRELMGSW